MSTVVTGEPDALFESLKASFQSAAALGDVVMVVSLSNCCPITPRGSNTNVDFPTPADVRNLQRQKPEQWRDPAEALRMIMPLERIRHPFRIVLNEQPTPVRSRNAALPERLAAVIDRSVKNDPAARFHFAAAFRDALWRAL